MRSIVALVLTAASAYLLGKLLYRLRDVVLLMLVGGFLAMVLNPQVNALQRWGVKRRGYAVAIVALWAVVIFFGLAVAFGYPLVNGISHLANSLPGYVDKAQHGKGWIGHVLRKYHIETWFQKNSSKLVTLAQGLSRPAFALGKGAISVVLGLLTMFAFVVLLLLEAPKMGAFLLGAIAPARAERLRRIGAEVSRSASGYVLGNVLTSIVAGVVVFVTLTVLSVPFALLWGLWVALVDFLPSIGGALAGIPTVLFALGHSFSAGVVTAIVFIAYTQIENHLLNPLVMSRTVRLNPLTVFMAVLVGAAVGAWVGGLFGGFVGVLLSVPGAATIQIVLKELWLPSGTAAQGAATTSSDADGTAARG
ncbi:MAG TPA: AI-2E family transporter [Acidimicrobiales bacterium]|nr:AI-2E family transporter [Acidimicrobiales bacterium]